MMQRPLIENWACKSSWLGGGIRAHCHDARVSTTNCVAVPGSDRAIEQLAIEDHVNLQNVSSALIDEPAMQHLLRCGLGDLQHLGAVAFERLSLAYKRVRSLALGRAPHQA